MTLLQGWRWPGRRRTRVLLALLGLAAALLLLLDQLFPLPAAAWPESPARRPLQAMVVLAEDGTPLRHWPGADGAMRHRVRLEQVSPLYLQALLQYEDRAFWWHPGVNPAALLRAAWQWVRAGQVVSGGSTLTMQVARLLDPDCADRQRNMHSCATRTAGAKARQLLRALQLEWHLSKQDILTLYLNEAPMGGMVEGVEMAAQAYLGKSARELSHAEAALLVALPQSPSLRRPDRHAQRAQAARDKVLQRLLEQGVWSAQEVQDARLEKVFAPPLRARVLAPLLAERLRQRALQAGAAVVPSLLDAGLQQRLEQVLLDRLNTLPESVSIAALIVDNRDGAVRAYAGSADFADMKRAAHVDMVRGLRSPGSTLKPFLYAMALDQGLLHSESLLVDAPQNFGGYAPGNFQADFSGPVSMSEALQRSLNVPAVDVLERLGPERFAAQLRSAGLRLQLPANAAPNLSLILGGGSTRLEELVGAYTALARGGVALVPRLQASDALRPTRLMSEGAAFIVREILENGGRPGAPFRESGARVAWKTGTSFGFRDAWALGVTDRYTLGVWMGRPDGTPNPGHFGANSAAPLLRDLADLLGPQQLAPRRQPASVQVAPICWPLGRLASSTPPEQCLQQRSAWLLDGAAPPTLPERGSTQGLEVSVMVDAAARQRLSADCAAPGARTLVAVRWPTLLQPWIEPSARHWAERLPWRAGCRGEGMAGPSARLRLVGLESGSVLRPTPGQAHVRLPVQVLGAQGAVAWLLDGQLLDWQDKGQPGHGRLLLQPKHNGEQQLTALDEQGHYARLRFTVQGLPP
ncbi:penicillin-binding protein 1C [Roseateles sp. BYS180W]|uniref:peptidoglycan glycosyltransferase n=1 Tax=Roseateles rivi TaxID=3299028 RepID=A0ABW7FYP9_9BURK